VGLRLENQAFLHAKLLRTDL